MKESALENRVSFKIKDMKLVEMCSMCHLTDICELPTMLMPLSAAAAASLQSCLTLCDPIDGSPPGSPVPGILQARTLDWVAVSFSNAWRWKVKVKSLSCVWVLVTPQTAAHQDPLSMGFSRQEYWSGVPLPSPSVYTVLKKWNLTPRREIAQTLQLLASVLTYLGKLQSVMGCIHAEPDPNLRNKEVLCEEMMHVLKSERWEVHSGQRVQGWEK